MNSLNNNYNTYCKFNILIISILLLPYIFTFLSTTIYLPGSDESKQIEAALYFINNGELFYSNLNINNISAFSWKFQNEWPFGYSFLLIVFLYFLKNIFITLKIIKLTFILLNIYSWTKISNNILKYNLSKYLFTVILVLITILISESVTDLIITYILSLIISITILLNNNRNKMIYYLKLGILCGIAFSFKYSSIFLLPSILCILLYINFSFYLKNLKYIFIIISIFFAFFLNVYIFNTSHGDHKLYNFSNIDLNKLINFFYSGWLSEITKVLSESLFIDKVYFILKIPLKYYFYLHYLSFIIILFFLYKSIINEAKHHLYINLITIFYLVNILILKILTALFTENYDQYKPINIPRYFWPITPLFYLLFVFYILNKFKISRFILYPIIFLIFSIILIDCRNKFQNFKRIEKNRHLLLYNLKKLNLLNSNNEIIIFAEKLQYSLYMDKGKYNVYEIDYSTNFKLENIKSTNKLILIYLNDANNYSLQISSKKKINKSLVSLLKNRCLINDNLSIYWTILD